MVLTSNRFRFEVLSYSFYVFVKTGLRPYNAQRWPFGFVSTKHSLPFKSPWKEQVEGQGKRIEVSTSG